MLHCPLAWYTISFFFFFCQHWITWYKSTWVYTEWNRNLGGLQKQPTSETEHDKYCKLVMPEIVLLLAQLFCTLHTIHANYFLHSSHKSHVKYTFGQIYMKLLFSLLIWFFTNACLDYLNYIYESTCKSYSEYENNFRKKKIQLDWSPSFVKSP